MDKGGNILFKITVCGVVVFALIQSSDYRKKSEELGNLKQTVTSLQADINRKDTELKELTDSKTRASDLEVENTSMKEEIKKLEKTSEDMNIYLQTKEDTLSSLSQEIIGKKAKKVIGFIKDKDVKSLSKYVHPKNGLRLSSSTDIKTDIDTVVSKEQLPSLLSDKTKYKWGALDGEGNQIELTFEEYYGIYIYDADYAEIADVYYNKDIKRSEKTSTIHDTYKNSIIVEYFNKGTKDNEYTDWTSVYLVFSKYNNKWYLSGIAHS